MDTAICIDLLRGYPKALLWHSSSAEPMGLPGFVCIELIIGCRNSLELEKCQKFIHLYAIVWPLPADLNLTITSYAPLKLSHGIGGFDALIAATVIGGGHILITRNIKHFQAIPGLAVETPYE